MSDILSDAEIETLRYESGNDMGRLALSHRAANAENRRLRSAMKQMATYAVHYSNCDDVEFCTCGLNESLAQLEGECGGNTFTATRPKDDTTTPIKKGGSVNPYKRGGPGEIEHHPHPPIHERQDDET